MSIIPCGKSDLFKSDLDKFKERYASQFIKEALDDIPELTWVDAENAEPVDSEAKCEHGHEASTCAGDCDDKEVVVVKKKDKDLKDVVKEGDEVESCASLDPRYISIADLKQTLAKMNEADRDKLVSYWGEILGDDWAKALVKEY